MVLCRIKAKAECDVEFGRGMDSKEEFFNFLDSEGIDKTDELYNYYIKCFNNALDFVCEFISTLAECFD